MYALVNDIIYRIKQTPQSTLMIPQYTKGRVVSVGVDLNGLKSIYGDKMLLSESLLKLKAMRELVK